ncbi:ParA family protein, partial [Roseomonas sp. KE0001]|nr:ParA family protein [Roseomonas sp. KE0001]
MTAVSIACKRGIALDDVETGVKVITVGSRKGGSGKTVLSRHLAVSALRSGIERVAIVDLDPMSGISRWWQRR